jgi:hypothetical protein
MVLRRLTDDLSLHDSSFFAFRRISPGDCSGEDHAAGRAVPA